MNANESVKGACLCGAVRFEVTLPVKFCAHCHCSMCRRAHGAPVVTWTGVKQDQFRVTEGEEQLTRYASSPEAQRSFCSVCGSTLLFESERWAGEVHIVVANLEQLAGIEPQAHVFYDDRADWLTTGDDLPRLGGKSGVEPILPDADGDG